MRIDQLQSIKIFLIIIFFGFFLSFRSEMRKVGHEKPNLAHSLPQEWGWAF